jgi:hypothetical protein
MASTNIMCISHLKTFYDGVHEVLHIIKIMGFRKMHNIDTINLTATWHKRSGYRSIKFKSAIYANK